MQPPFSIYRVLFCCFMKIRCMDGLGGRLGFIRVSPLKGLRSSHFMEFR